MTADHDVIQTLAEKVHAIENRQSVTEHRLNSFDRAHEMTPNRLTKLEQQFENLTRQLSIIGTTLKEISNKQDVVGKQIAYGLGAGAVLLVVLDKVWPMIAAIGGS
jgi:chromosome segregation ATPase